MNLHLRIAMNVMDRDEQRVLPTPAAQVVVAISRFHVMNRDHSVYEDSYEFDGS